VQANLRYPASVAAACEGAYAVINATGTDVSSGAQSFDAVVVFGSEAVAKAARQAKASLMLMVSGMAADAESPSLASQAKAKAEAATAGPDDRFFNRMAGLVRFAPVLPVIAPETKVQPVFVGDVAEAMATLVDRGVADGKTYELGGPATGTLQDMMQYVVDVTQRKRLLLPLPHGAAKLFGLLIGWLPGAPINADQVEMLQGNNVVSAAAHAEGRDLAGLGITPRAFATIVPTYLYRFRKEGQFTVPN